MFRGPPILSMLEKMRLYLMERVRKQKTTMNKYTSQICPASQEKLNNIKVELAPYIPS